MGKLCTLSELLLIIIVIASCQSNYNEKIHYPSNAYHFVEVDTSKFITKKMVYVPIYSDIYMISGRQKSQLAATLSIRNITFSDTLYISDVDYYSSQGKLLKRYIDSTLIVKPMESIEFVVDQSENEGGVGANFIVKWGALKQVHSPLIHGVMIGTHNSLGISFTSEGVVVE